jgi:hypothetical protein
LDPFVIIENELRIDGRKLDMGDPSTGNSDGLDFVPRSGVEDSEVRAEAFGLDASIDAIVGLIGREWLFIVKGAGIDGGNAEAFAIRGNVGECGHLASRQFSQGALMAAEIGDANFAALEVIDQAVIGI